jgi:hypothetical protein
VTNCVFIGNWADQGGGVYVDGGVPDIINCTFIYNWASQGGAIHMYLGAVHVINCILWDNKWDQIYQYAGGYVKVSHSCIEGGWPGTGNIKSDPLFVDTHPFIEDFHLTYQSPCRNTGDNAAVTVSTDYEGDMRIAYGRVDMGADEFYTHLYHLFETKPGGTSKIKLVGIPSTSPLAIYVGTGVLGQSIPTNWGQWWNEWWLAFPLLGMIELGKIPSPDGVYILSGRIPPSSPYTYSIPLQAIIGDSLTNLCVIEVK